MEGRKRERLLCALEGLEGLHNYKNWERGRQGENFGSCAMKINRLANEVIRHIPNSTVKGY